MTAQRSDKLIYKSNEYELASEPLYPYLKGTGIRLVQISTACHRGYVAEWLVEDDKLFLTDFNAFIPNKDTDKNWVNKDEIEEVGLEYLFPNQDKVFAEWFSGVLRVPHGEMIRYVHQGYASIYEKELYLRFVNGKYVSYREIDNTRLKDDKNAIAEREMDGIWESIFGVKRSELPEKKSWWKKLLDKQLYDFKKSI